MVMVAALDQELPQPPRVVARRGVEHGLAVEGQRGPVDEVGFPRRGLLRDRGDRGDGRGEDQHCQSPPGACEMAHGVSR
jgi:hypothetical protein